MLTQDTIGLVESASADIKKARESVLDLIDKEKSLNGSNSRGRQDKLRVIKNKLDNLIYEVEHLYT